MVLNRPQRARTVPLVAAAVAAGIVVGAATASATVDDPVDAGGVVVVDATDPGRELLTGDSNTVFSLRLPPSATCPGDSANDDWRVQSFVVPDSVDPGALTYGAIRPVGEGLHALYRADTTPFVQVLTGQNAEPGRPGQILAIPPLSFAVFPAGMLPAGRYRIGVACTYFRETARFWDLTIELVDAPGVQPGGFRWTVAGSSPTDDGGSGSGIAGILGGLGLAVVVGAVLLGRRRHRAHAHTSSPIKEQR